jgi:hypothetical protein
MFKQKIFIYSFIVLILVAIFNYLGTNYYFYITYDWYDIPMHILGGLWVSLFTIFLYTLYYKNTLIKENRKRILSIVCIALLFMTISWEMFEIISKITLPSDGALYWIDTIKDITDGYIGGMIGYFFYIKK